ncbi:MAG: hypothetical protein IPG17_30315 [Sandaracinaceae bacterium]|nr:hypothetical protein [Sandaracinaceae bacterium]
MVAAIRDVTPPIDMIILDEAHRVRNRDTLQYKLASALCESAYSKLFLSATPLQTGLDLHTLLDLLEPGRFGSAPDFQEFSRREPPHRAGDGAHRLWQVLRGRRGGQAPGAASPHRGARS